MSVVPDASLSFVTDENFPPHAWLGYGLDMTSITPTDITTVTKSVVKFMRLVTMKNLGTEKIVDGDVKWVIPWKGVGVSSDVDTGATSYSSYADGTSAASAIEFDSSLAVKYLAVGLDASASYSISKSFSQSYQYALFSFDQNLLQVAFEDFDGAINNVDILNRIEYIPTFDSKSPDVVSQYKLLFSTIGSHVITGASYGSRFQLTVRTDNSDSTQKENFNTNVSVAFNGLTSSGHFDASIKQSSEYQAFSNLMQKTCSCQGGDPTIAGELSSDPSSDDVYEQFQKWIGTSHTNPDVMSMQTQPLWVLMSGSNDRSVQQRAPDIQKAFNWIVANPGLHETKCRFVIGSDWGEIGLLTPSAFIVPDPSSPAPIDNTYFGSTKITWGKEFSRKFERDVAIDFIIRNDGSPVEIQLSHGSDGAAPGKGQCSVTIYGKEYLNQDITGDIWNSKWFYQCVVDPYEVVKAVHT